MMLMFIVVTLKKMTQKSVNLNYDFCKCVENH